MDFILELLFEIILEGSIELGSERRVPMPIRIIALLFFLLVYGFVIFALFMVGYDAAKSGEKGTAYLIYAIDAFLFIFVIYVIRKKFKEHRK